jgi:hypothetical protein
MSENPEPEVESDGEVPSAQEDRIVDRAVTKLRKVIQDLLPVPDPKDPEQVEHEVAGLPAEPTTTREVEKDLEAQVAAAMKKIHASDEHEQEHKKIKEEKERPPMTFNKVTKFLWGSEK